MCTDCARHKILWGHVYSDHWNDVRHLDELKKYEVNETQNFMLNE